LNGTKVACRSLQEMSFENGQLVEIARKDSSQAEDGTVYCFNESVDIYQNGAITSHEGSWLAGGPTPSSDPEGAAHAPAPTVVVPANPQLDDTFKQEDWFPRCR
jgi:hypothetical protein